jgi:hypothetical protein
MDSPDPGGVVGGSPEAPRWKATGAACILLCALVAGASFLKADLPRNDFERFDDLRLSFLFFLLFAAWGAVYLTAYERRCVVPARIVWLTTVACVALLLLSFPVGSKDVFGYAFFGKAWGLYGANPYLSTPADFPEDPWQPFLQVRWRSDPAVYGPLFLWQSRLVDVVAGERLWLAVWLHKGIAAAALLGSLLVAWRLVPAVASGAGVPASWLLLLLAWNPLLLFESAGGAHNDVVMVLLLLGALWFWRRGSVHTALGALALAFWYKWYAALFVPLFLLETLKTRGIRATMGQAFVCAGATVAMGALLLAALPGSLPAVVYGSGPAVACAGLLRGAGRELLLRQCGLLHVTGHYAPALAPADGGRPCGAGGARAVRDGRSDADAVGPAELPGHLCRRDADVAAPALVHRAAALGTLSAEAYCNCARGAGSSCFGMIGLWKDPGRWGCGAGIEAQSRYMPGT